MEAQVCTLGGIVMIMVLRIPAISQLYYNLLIQDLFGLADCVIRSKDGGVIIETHGDKQVCSEIVKICEKYQLKDELF